MAKKNKKMMTADAVKSLVGKHIANAQGFYSGNLSKTRETALDYYLGNPMGNEIDGRSKVISSDVSDAIEPLMANLMRIFTQSNKLFHCEPVGTEDVEIAEQSTDYINHIFFKKNNGWVILHNFLKDALLEKNGFLKVYHEYSDKVTRESYFGLSDDEYTMLIDDKDVEVIEHTEYEDDSNTHQMPDGSYMAGKTHGEEMGMPVKPPVDEMMAMMGGEMPMPMEMPIAMLHDVVIHRIAKKGKTCIESIPPEEILVESNAKSIEDANFIAQKKMMTRGELIELGFERDIVDTLPTERVEDMNTEFQTRHSDIHNSIQRDITDESTQEVEVFECYVKCDYSGTGKSELRKFVVAGNNGETLLSDEAYDSFPFVTATPIIMPHRLYGRSIAELVQDVQSVKTYVMRALNDNIYGIQNNRLAIDDSRVNVSDILANRPNMIVRTKGNPMESIQTMPVQSIGDTAYPLLTYYDELKEQRTGVSKIGQGLNADALNSKTSTGLNSVMSQAQQRVEFIARTFAHTGINDLGKKILECVVKYQDKEDIIRIRNKFVTYKPMEWRDRCDISITSGLGTGNQDQQMIFLNNILERQVQALTTQGNPSAPLVNLSKIYNTLEMMVESAGLKNVDLFFLNPEENPMPEEEPKQPTEFEKVSMAQIEGENKRKLAELELKHQELLMKNEKQQLDFDAKIVELELQYQKNIDQEEIKRQAKVSTEAMKQVGAFANKNMPMPQPNIPPNDPMNVPMPRGGIQPPVAPAEPQLTQPNIQNADFKLPNE
jgi:hypothetical protein|tara:strand:- start:4508 stop:6826 length:2319 start_codon:yes stop_codon:yes gene_type:complete